MLIAAADALVRPKENPYVLTMITSKLTSKAQTTIPQSVRNALQLKPGDDLVYTIEKDRVTLSKAEVVPADDPFTVFAEWDSAADRSAYADL